MDTVSLAQALDLSRDAEGSISLRELARHLETRGLHEFSRAATALAERVILSPLKVSETAPWV